MKYCGDCHDPADDSNHVRFLKANKADDLRKGRALWKNVALQLRNRTMPPADEEQPSEEDRFAISVWISDTLKATACDAGETAALPIVRRLNRIEYDYTVEDLIGIDFDFADRFPADGGGGEGFDNNGETLFLPPLLMERYLEAAQTILDAAIITPRLERAWNEQQLERSTQPGKRLVSVTPNIYLDDEYRVAFGVKPNGQAAKVRLLVDGIKAEDFDVAADLPSVELKSEIKLTRGFHIISLQVSEDAALQVGQVRLKQDEPKVSDQKRNAHRRLFPEGTASNREAARQIVERFASQAFRRPVAEDEIDRLMRLYDRSAERDDPFEESVKLALKGVLVSPQFLFRLEPDDPTSTTQSLNDFALATRLSYFLWVSMPDKELFDLARQGKLNQPEVLKQQVQRMLADPKSKRFSREFVGQWLGTREVGRRSIPSTSKFKGEFTTELLIDFRTEVVEFMHHLLQENVSLNDFLMADYSFVNQRLAKQYGVSDIKGDEFRKIRFEDGRRGGVVGMGAVHLLTSYPERTSPVLRGAWVLESLLGTPVPSPPADVPPLKEAKVAKKAPLREKLSKHRDNPACAACHDVIDPLGFSLENFDVLSRWQDKDNDGNEIDNSATMPTGQEFSGPDGLRSVLAERTDDYIHHLTEKMLGYALGRSLQDADQCTVQKIVHQLEENEFRAQTLVEAIVLSTPFRFRDPPQQ